MLTERLYMMNGQCIADVYSGNKESEPIAMMDFEKATVIHSDGRFRTVIKNGEHNGVISSDRVYFTLDLPSEKVQITQEIADDPKLMQKVRPLKIVRER